MKLNLKIINLKNIILVVLTISAVISIFGLFISKFYLSSYRLVTKRELVAIVECVKDADKKTILQVEYYPGSEISTKKTYEFNADEWVIEGRIVKWKPLLGVFGVDRYYKLERLSGRYIDIEKEKTMPRLVYAISKSPDRFWLFLYKYQKCLPFIDAVYGNSAFIRFEPQKKYNVYMTSTGFMIKDVTIPTTRKWWNTG
jgi:hypothetical protein